MLSKKGGDETDSVVYSKALEKIDFTELRSFHQEREQRRQQELEEVSLKIKVEFTLILKKNRDKDKAITKTMTRA